MCFSPDSDDGVAHPIKERGAECSRFSPRKTCTTCDRRCSQEEKDERVGPYGGCAMWKLRSLSTWGGRRRSARWLNKSNGGEDEVASTNTKGE